MMVSLQTYVELHRQRGAAPWRGKIANSGHFADITESHHVPDFEDPDEAESASRYDIWESTVVAYLDHDFFSSSVRAKQSKGSRVGRR